MSAQTSPSIPNKQLVGIPVNGVEIEGLLEIPRDAKGIVVFAHGSGSSRHSPRNSFVAQVLRHANCGTLLVDLLTRQEDSLVENRFDIGLLTWRLERVSQWLMRQAATADFALGYFGASTGAAAALQAAATFGATVRAVVSRGGRPDLAMKALPRVDTPTLLIVGGRDDVVIDLNRAAFEQLTGEKQLVIVPGATHLFEEPGTLDEVARLAAAWFEKYFAPG